MQRWQQEFSSTRLTPEGQGAFNLHYVFCDSEEYPTPAILYYIYLPNNLMYSPQYAAITPAIYIPPRPSENWMTPTYRVGDIPSGRLNGFNCPICYNECNGHSNSPAYPAVDPPPRISTATPDIEPELANLSMHVPSETSELRRPSCLMWGPEAYANSEPYISPFVTGQQDSVPAANEYPTRTYPVWNQAEQSPLPERMSIPIRCSRLGRHGQQGVPYAGTQDEQGWATLPRPEVLRVPAMSACQLGRSGPPRRCPLGRAPRRHALCLYVGNIRDWPLRHSYNWLTRLFERYPGFRHIHLIQRHRAAIVEFETDELTTVLPIALDIYRLYKRYQLHVYFVGSEIYNYINEPNFRPQDFNILYTQNVIFDMPHNFIRSAASYTSQSLSTTLADLYAPWKLRTSVVHSCRLLNIKRVDKLCECMFS